MRKIPKVKIDDRIVEPFAIIQTVRIVSGNRDGIFSIERKRKQAERDSEMKRINTVRIREKERRRKASLSRTPFQLNRF